MAGRIQPLTSGGAGPGLRAPARAPGVALVMLGGGALLLVAGLTLGPIGALAWRAEPGQGSGVFGAADWAALRFTLLQSLLSATVSVALALPAARALARRRFPGRDLAVSLLGAPFLLPAIVVVFGVVAIWGRAGLVSQGLGAVGLAPLSIYGLPGVVLAHVFFNLPLATRLILQGWGTIPPEQFRLAAQLGFGPRDVFRRIELPMLRGVLPGAFILVFLLCMTSFAVALTLGGGPRATTVELAIYQAVRFDFDLARAARLALMQFALCGAVALVAMRVRAEAGFGGGLRTVARRWDAQDAGRRGLDAGVFGALALFLGLPVGAILLGGIRGLAELPAATWPAAARSLGVALASAALAMVLALPLALLIDAARARGRGRGLETLALLAFAASPFVMGTGLFILIHPVADPFAVALPLTATVNAVMAMPFALRALLPAVAEVRLRDGRLADSLGLHGLIRFRLVAWPRLRAPAGFAAGLAAALSMGDLGVIALFAPPEVVTLPLLMERLMGAYRMQAAAGVALVLVLLTFALFWAFDRGGRRNAG